MITVLRGDNNMYLIESGERRFFIEQDGQKFAEITYTPVGDDTIIIDHTFVSDALRGQRIAEKLVYKVVEKARMENKKIIPLCPFAKSQFMRHEEYQDVLK
ncbi:hypothetical protein AF333_20945 [Aneurinibacillus migulanus]|uniref:N-acetyltransferase domain-containing protein n=2 Tax=Aneurinibacillus migulanus TaxID=47500 RepID=A0A0M0H641_ANEMI|nr:hypothetical protein AF333_20945 [Aneurinibacillus migulanus]